MASLTDRINAAIQANNTEESSIKMGPVEVPARTYLSPTDSYENQISFDNPLDNHAPGAMRGMWSVAEQQQASVPVTALRVGNTNSNSIAAIQGGIKQSPRAPATVWAAVPQMLVNLNVKGPVMIQASVSVRSSVGADTAGFAIYRDGKLIGNHLSHALPPTASAVALIQMSAMDNAPLGNHIYALYWSPGTGTLVAHSNQRNLYAINLSPQ